MSLKNKIAIVTGGNSGIGQAIVLELARQEASMVIDYVVHPEATETLERQVSKLGSQSIGVAWHLDAFLLSIALERVTIERLMLARVVAAAVVRRSAAVSPGTFVVGWRPPPFGRRHSVRSSPPSRRS